MNRIRKFLKTGHIFRACKSGEEPNYCNRSVPYQGLLVFPSRDLAPYMERWLRQMWFTTADEAFQQTLKHLCEYVESHRTTCSIERVSIYTNAWFNNRHRSSQNRSLYALRGGKNLFLCAPFSSIVSHSH